MKPFEVRTRSDGHAVYHRKANQRKSGFYSDIDLALTICDRINRKHLEASLKTTRKCMCCSTKFQSQGIHNRLCGNCGRSGLGKEMVDPCVPHL